MLDYATLSTVALAHLTPDRQDGPSIPDSEAGAVVEFWRAAGPLQWFAKDPAFDTRFRERFLRAHEAAARRELMAWLTTAQGALALVLLLDQFPRNAFRGTARMYHTDALAREIAARALSAGYDQTLEPELWLFIVLPFGHSENAADQARSVELASQLPERERQHAIRHRDIVRRFGRFPHRNSILGRSMTREEQAYLDAGGYQG